MNIDKTFLKEYLLKSKENAYLLELYKIYEICNKVTNKNILKNKKSIDRLEDKIYTVNGKELSNKERVVLELKKIIKEFSKCQKDIVKNDVAAELNALIIYMDNNQQESNKYYEVIKQKIAVIEAKLYIPISFLYAGAVAFLDKYESEYINNKVFIDEDTIVKLFNKDFFKENDNVAITKEYYDTYINNKDIINKANYYKEYNIYNDLKRGINNGRIYCSKNLLK